LVVPTCALRISVPGGNRDSIAWWTSSAGCRAHPPGPSRPGAPHPAPANRALVRSVLPDRSRKCGIAAVRVAEQCDTPGDRYPLLDHPSRPVVLVILHLAAPFRVACGPELPAPVSRTTKLRTQHCDAA